MLKVRLAAVLVVKGGILVQSIGFKTYLPIGSPVVAVDYLNRWGIDEITMLDIDATQTGNGPNVENIRACSRYCQVPLAVGGGIRHIDDVKNVIHGGADKVVLHTAAAKNPDLIRQGAELFGNQCMVVSIDALKVGDQKYQARINSGKESIGYTPAEFAQKVERYGAGEILLNSIDRDGSKQGYDLNCIQQVLDAVNIPVIVCGGVGHPQHFEEAMRLNVSAIAAGNFFHFTEQSVITAKSYLRASGVDIRLDSYAKYDDFDFDQLGRPSKMDDLVLEKLRFEYTPEEVI